MTLIYLGLAWLLGIYYGQLLKPPPAFLLLALPLPLVVLALWRRERTARLAALCGLCLLAGAWRFTITIPHFGASDLATYNDQGQVTLRGLVTGEPDERDTYTNLRLDAESMITPGGAERAVRGVALLRAPRYPEYRYGDRLQVTGRLETPPAFETFSYRDYLARRGVYTIIGWPGIELLARDQGSRFWAALYAFKKQAQGVIARLTPEPQAALLTGILLGVETGIPRDLYERFNATGTSHIIVISGANIALVVALLMGLGKWVVGKRRAALLAVVGVILYTLLVGADAAVVRAAIMGSLAALALYFGRQATALNSLVASAIVLTAINPLALWDLGFQLSFAASLGLILLVPPLTETSTALFASKLSGERLNEALGFLRELLLVTLAAQVAVTPILIAAFGRLSPVSLLVNFLILPLQPAVMIGGAVATAVGLIPFLTWLAQGLFWIPWLALAYTTTVVDWAASLPQATVEVGKLPGWALVLCYGAMLGAVWLYRQGAGGRRALWERITRKREGGSGAAPAEVRRTSTVVLLSSLAGAVILAWVAAFSLPDGRLHVAFLDVGQGDAIFITTPRGQQILVDGGPSPSALLSGLGRRMPFWDRSIDLLLLTHPDSDHLAGLVPVLERYEVRQVLESAGAGGNGPTYEQWRALIAQKGIPLRQAVAGMRIETGDGVVLEVLNPPPGMANGKESDNDLSVVVRLLAGRAAFLLTGDAEARAEGWMVAAGRPLQSTVLKVSHHGSGEASAAPFLAAVRPQLAVISVGAGNRFGHPAPEVLERLAATGVQVLRTDERGTIELLTDGERLWVETER
jgi:competence protein ComEC